VRTNASAIHAAVLRDRPAGTGAGGKGALTPGQVIDVARTFGFECHADRAVSPTRTTSLAEFGRVAPNTANLLHR
jgi:hypothetical protein